MEQRNTTMILRLSLPKGTSAHINTPKRLLIQQSRAFSSIDDPAFRAHSTAVADNTSSEYRSWQASQNIDIQRVTQTAMVHELTQQVSRSIEKVVPWFFNTMPAPYFRQVPESFRVSTFIIEFRWQRKQMHVLCIKLTSAFCSA